MLCEHTNTTLVTFSDGGLRSAKFNHCNDCKTNLGVPRGFFPTGELLTHLQKGNK